MITIRITNAKEVVRKHKGWLVQRVGGMVVEWEEIVERRVIAQIQQELAKSGVEAAIEHVPTPGEPGIDPLRVPPGTE
jgi:hypothetical protein